MVVDMEKILGIFCPFDNALVRLVALVCTSVSDFFLIV